MRFLYVMDPLDTVQIHLDSTFALMLESQARGHEVLYCLVNDLYLEHERPGARCRPVTVRAVQGEHFTTGEVQRVALADLDAVFMRKDPPFDIEYVFATWLLSMAPDDTLIVNNATSIRSHNEKLYALHFPDFCPPSAVSALRSELIAFQERLGDTMVVKPLDGNGGEGIYIVRADDPNRNVIIEQSTRHGRRPVIAQKYLPQAKDGDKRVLIIDGEFEGAVLRVPSGADPRGNLHVGARSVKTTLTPREQAMVAALGPALRDAGHVFVGIDVIGEHLTEVNVTSPTGIHEINALDGRCVQARIIDAVQRRVEAATA